MDEPISILEMRRRAPLHFWSKANNARFSAYLLWTVDQKSMNSIAADISYSDNTVIATAEAFRREAALALELIIKAVVAQNLQRGKSKPGVTGVRTTHDLPSLWVDANLPALSKSDQARLLRAKYILLWTGRYAAPKTDKEYQKMLDEEEKLEQDVSEETSKILQRLSFNFEDFDRLYQIACASFNNNLPNFADDNEAEQ